MVNISNLLVCWHVVFSFWSISCGMQPLLINSYTSIDSTGIISLDAENEFDYTCESERKTSCQRYYYWRNILTVPDLKNEQPFSHQLNSHNTICRQWLADLVTTTCMNLLIIAYSMPHWWWNKKIHKCI